MRLSLDSFPPFGREYADARSLFACFCCLMIFIDASLWSASLSVVMDGFNAGVLIYRVLAYRIGPFRVLVSFWGFYGVILSFMHTQFLRELDSPLSIAMSAQIL